MFHSEIFNRIKKIIKSNFIGKKYSLLDIGCGESFGISKFIADTNLENYLGIDKSETALVWAKNNLKNSEIKYSLEKSNFEESLEKISTNFDIFLSGYSLHHLKSYEEKKKLIQKFIERLPPGGFFILFDLIKKNKETLPEYHNRYIQNCKDNWKSINPREMEIISNHIRNNDYPLTLDKWKEAFTIPCNHMKIVSIDAQNPYYVFMCFKKQRINP